MKIDDLKQLVRADLKIIDGDGTTVRNLIRCSAHRGRPVGKNVQSSEQARTEGNRLYEQTGFDPVLEYRILHLYTESVAFAPLESAALASAYGNRSALLKRMRRFNHCITEADKALKITQLIPLRIKLLCRKAECFTAMRLSGSGTCLEEARALLTKSEDSSDIKIMLEKLINRAQFFVDNPTLEVHETEKLFDESEMQALKVVEDAERTTSVEESFKVKYSKKYGHYLVAARDFKPGEIMCVEKPYHNLAMDCKTPSYCCQCLKFLWTVVACDLCSWHVYCTEQCKTDAWNEYHDIECLPTQKMKEILSLREFVDLSPCTIFFKALKEAGSIEKLQADLELLDKYEDHSDRHFNEDGSFFSYKTLYLTPLRILTKSEFDSCVRAATLSLIGYAKQVLKTTYDFYDIKKLMKDETAIFMAAFLCKLEMINKGRVQQVKQFDPSQNGCEKSPTNHSIILAGMLAPISCAPNVEHVGTVNNRSFIYAMEPIKAGTQIFSSIYLSMIYTNAQKSQRDNNYKYFYGHPCDCRACTDDWSEKLTNPAEFPMIPDEKSDLFEELSEEMYSIRRDMQSSPLNKLGIVDSEIIVRMRALIAKSWEHFPMPSLITFDTVKLMMKSYEAFFSPKNRLAYRLR